MAMRLAAALVLLLASDAGVSAQDAALLYPDIVL